MQNRNTYYLAGLVGIISVSLLIGYRFDAGWAGGSGYQAHQLAMIDGNEYERGEIFRTKEDQWSKGTIGKVYIWLDQNTEVKLIDGREGKITVNVIQGRIITDGTVTIQTREVLTKLLDLSSFVHYSWLDEAEVISFTGGANIIFPEDIVQGENQKDVQTSEIIQFSTLEPYTFKSSEFNFEESVAEAFYRQALSTPPF